MNKKLAFALLVVGTLGATTLAGCGNSTSPAPTTDTEPTSTEPTITPVSEITVARPANDIVVGDTIDLDELVTLEGGNDPHGFTVTVRPASEEVVSLDGHVLTVLKEGPISLLIEAGAQSSLVNWEALSLIKAQYKAATQGISTNYATFDLGTDANGNVVTTGEGSVHNDSYYYSVAYDKTTQKNLGEGMVLLDDGNFYDFTAEELDAQNLEVQPGPTPGASWSNYFVNMSFAASYQDMVTVTEVDETTGEEYSYLELSADVAVPSEMEDYAYNMADYVFLTTWGASVALQQPAWQAQFDTSTIRIIAENVATEGEDPEFALQVLITGAEGTSFAGQELYLAWSVISGAEEDYTLDSVEEYIASGEIPEGIDLTPVEALCGAVAKFTNYSQQTTFYSISNTTGQPITEGNVMSGRILTQVDSANKVFNNAVMNADGSAADYVYGYAEIDGTLYFYQPNEDYSAYVVQAANGTFADVLGNIGAPSWASVGVGDLLATSSVDYEADDVKEIVVNDVSSNGAFALNLLNTLPLYGSGMVSTLNTPQALKYVANCAITFDFQLSTGGFMGMTIDVPINYGTFTPLIQVAFGSVGTTNCSSIVSLVQSLLAE